jgi:hypothetical protein
MSNKPEALEIAEALEEPDENGFSTMLDMTAASELRRLHAINAQMMDALQQAVALADANVRLGLYGEPDRTPACAASYALCVAAIAAATGEQS